VKSPGASCARARFRETDVDGKDARQDICKQGDAEIELDGKRESIFNRPAGKLLVPNLER
jgi:hypothetical protein